MWETLGKRLLESAGFRLASGRINTFPAFRPIRPLDAIYIRGNLSVLNCFRIQSLAAKRASDHLPVVADFQMI
jgi:endonuclease/exonuclease/phosphatase family metal-dependent hydrolase